MKIVSTNNRYDVYDDTLRTYDELPAQVYIVRFIKMQGFFLEKYDGLAVGEEKIYGVHESKTEKVMSAFEIVERNLGVILSGDKGIGKSLFARVLADKAVKSGIPVIIVDTYIPGIAAYLESINQKVMVLFDEFDKTFKDGNGEGGVTPQETMLSLFDGTSAGKKLFVVTCNELRELNNYIVSRPGRFHYHFRFQYPSPDEVREYLMDKLDPAFHDKIEDVVIFSQRVELNYDSLRAVAFELNLGYSFKEAMEDLNIVRDNYGTKVAVSLCYGGLPELETTMTMDLFNEANHGIWLQDASGYSIARVIFNMKNAVFNASDNSYYIPGDKLRVSLDEDYENEILPYKGKEPEYLCISRTKEQFHFEL